MTSPNEHSEKGLTVGELIDILKQYDQDLPVWLAISDDSERCFVSAKLEDIRPGNIWHPEIDTDGEGPAETPGIIFGERRFFP